MIPKNLRYIVLGLGLILPMQAWAENDADFAAWLQEFRQDAVQQGIKPSALQALDDLSPDPRVVKLDGKQPEKKITFATYRTNILNPERIRLGRQLYQKHRAALRRVAKNSGVPAPIIVALWGIESSYGALTGNFSVLRSLATLAYEGRRAELFRRELLAALQILQSGRASLAELRGSWAGAMGQSQFMPSTYLAHARDGDGDDHADIWDSTPDVFASIANYLAHLGWDETLRWGREIALEQALPADQIGVRQTEPQPLRIWQSRGATELDGTPLKGNPRQDFYVVQPDGPDGSTYLVTGNYLHLMQWNRSTYFATSVGLLADAIAEDF
jgi:membrane-bound lytic murein transglycosylase B